MSIVRDLAELQVGIGRRNVNRLRERMIKNLITSPCREFKETTDVFNRGSNIFTFMHSGRLFRQSSLQPNKVVNTFSAYPTRISKKKKSEPKYKHQKLFSFPCNFKCKDLVIWSPDSPYATENLILHKARHTTSMVYLENSSYLVRRCCLTGKMEDRIFLSNTLKFAEISSDSESDLIALKSTRIKNKENPDCVFTIAIFSSPPLKFVAMFEVKTSIFGKNIQDAGITQGMIFIRYYNNKVALYSLDTILQNAITERVENMTEETRLKIGKRQFELPLNAEIKDVQPAIFEVDSYQGELVIGGNPWHFITKSSASQLQIKRLLTRELVSEVVYSTHFAEMEVEHLFFHPDDSKRLIHICNNKLCVYYLKDNHLEPFLIHKEERPSFNRTLQSASTRSGRTVKKSLAALEAQESQILEDENTLTHDLTISLDPDSNIFAIFSVAAKGPDQLKMLHIVLYDNSTGKLLRKIPLETVHQSSLFNVTCNLTLEGVNLFAEVRDKSFMHGSLLSLVEVF